MSTDNPLLIAAAVAAGPIAAYPSVEEWENALNMAASRLAQIAAHPRSPVNLAQEDSETLRKIPARLQGIVEEESSHRAVLTYIPDKPTKYTKNGVETVRTERLDSHPQVSELIKTINALGTRNAHVSLTIVNRDRDKSENGKGYRTLINVEEIL